MKKIYAGLGAMVAAVSMLVLPVVSLAQTNYYLYSTNYGYGTGNGYEAGYTSSGCLSLPTDFGLGYRDTAGSGNIANLQQFLMQKGYLSTSLATGYFGNATLAAVKNYQTDHDLPPTGFVGSLTRSVIQNDSCGTNYQNQNYYNYNNNYNNYTYPYITNTVTINSLTPTTGAPGTYITVYGSGFSQNGNTVHFGNATLSNISSTNNGTQLSFSVPYTLQTCTYNSYYNYQNCNNNYTNYYNNYVQSVGQGNYPITITNAQGNTSGVYTFYVTSSNYNYNYNYNNNAPVITSFTGPNQLSLGNQGVWSIVVNDSNNTNVTTSVRWGDENSYNNYGYQSGSQTQYIQGQQTLTFTHTYYNRGTYTIVVTVTDNSGQQNTSSMTINVY